MPVCKNRHRHVFTSCMMGGVERCPLLPSLILNLHLRYQNMSRATFFSGAHHFVVNNSTFIEAKTVSGMLTKVIFCQAIQQCWICCRSTSTAIGRWGSFPLCQTRALGSQGVQKSLPNSKDIFLLIQMMQFRKERSSCYMEWGVLERLRFA